MDFITIDIEGLDTELVLAIDLKAFTPSVILFEDNLNFGGSERVTQHLELHGYFHLFTSGGSVCFARHKE